MDIESPISDEKIADLWISLSEEMWRSVYITPVVGGGVAVAWFTLIQQRLEVLAAVVAALGIVMMVVQFFIIWRLSDYTRSMRHQISGKLPVVPPPPWRINGTTLARAVPTLFGMTFAVMAIGALMLLP